MNVGGWAGSRWGNRTLAHSARRAAPLSIQREGALASRWRCASAGVVVPPARAEAARRDDMQNAMPQADQAGYAGHAESFPLVVVTPDPLHPATRLDAHLRLLTPPPIISLPPH